MNEPTVINYNDRLKNNAMVENYLHEAALVKKAPSGNVYKNGNRKEVVLSGRYLLLNWMKQIQECLMK